jgi:spore coat protein U-like protein
LKSTTLSVSLGCAIALLLAHATLVAQAPAGSKTANIRVSAEVVANCIVTTTDVAFGRYDPVGPNRTAPLDAQGSIRLTCTKGSTAHVSVDQGQNGTSTARNMANGTARLPYLLAASATFASPNLAWTWTFQLPSTRSFQVYGRIAAGQDVPVGSYEDTVVVTVTF